MLDYPAARAVAMVVQTGSFEGAARALGVTPSAISQRVRALEERLGTVLIERASPCRATAAGDALCRHIELVGLAERDLMAHLPANAYETDRVTLSVAVNSDSLATWVLPALAGFARDADILLDIAVDDEDHTTDWLKSGRVVAALTAVAKPVQHLHHRQRHLARHRAMLDLHAIGIRAHRGQEMHLRPQRHRLAEVRRERQPVIERRPRWLR
jgi:LysR family transcriptional regulator, chromosome initiation inhibitor